MQNKENPIGQIRFGVDTLTALSTSTRRDNYKSIIPGWLKLIPLVTTNSDNDHKRWLEPEQLDNEKIKPRSAEFSDYFGDFQVIALPKKEMKKLASIMKLIVSRSEWLPFNSMTTGTPITPSGERASAHRSGLDSASESQRWLS
jgi:ubiquitin